MEEAIDDYFIKKGFKIETTPDKITYTQKIGGGKERIIKIDKYSLQCIFTEGDIIYPLCLDFEELTLIYKKSIEMGWNKWN